MADMAYREIHAMNPIQARKLLIRTYQETESKSQTARPVKYFDLFHGARLWYASRQASSRAQPSGGTQVGASLPGRGRGGAQGPFPQAPPLPSPNPS